MFSAGLLLGGAVVALVAALIGALALQSWMPRPVAAAVLAVALLVAFARDLGWIPIPLPQNARQVPEMVAGSGPRLGALQFGFEMGTGMRTFMTSALPHVVLLAIMVLADPWQALVAGLGFGLGRSLVPLARTVADDYWSDTFDRYQRGIRMALTGVVLLGLLVILAPATIG